METLQLNKKVSKKPKLYYYRKFPIRLNKQLDVIIHLKLHYKKNFKPLRVHFILPLEYNLDSKWNPIIRALEDYFDVLIQPHEYFQERNRRTISIIGTKDQLAQFVTLFNYIYHLYFGSVERKVRLTRLTHRQLRRKNRRNNTNSKIPDARIKISSFKSRLLGFLEVEIRKTLAHLEETPKIKRRGFSRRKRIKNYLWNKYKKRWKNNI